MAGNDEMLKMQCFIFDSHTDFTKSVIGSVARNLFILNRTVVILFNSYYLDFTYEISKLYLLSSPGRFSTENFAFFILFLSGSIEKFIAVLKSVFSRLQCSK